MADFKNKISNLINSQVPDFVLEDHPLFLDFVKAYYQLLESAEIKLWLVIRIQCVQDYCRTI